MSIPTPTFEKFCERVRECSPISVLGRVSQVVGLVIESDGPEARVGDLCYIEGWDNFERIEGEVVGFRGDKVLLMPLGEMTGVSAGCLVRNTNHCLRAPVGQNLLGRTLNGLGHPIDNLGPIVVEGYYPVQRKSVV